MKNIQGTDENLVQFHKNGVIKCKFVKDLGGYSYEYTYDENDNVLTYKNSDGYSSESTYNKNGNQLTFKNSDGYVWECTYDENGNELTYKDSFGDYEIKCERVTKEEYEAFINQNN